MSEKLAGTLVFATSAAVLVLEILAGRLLAPYAGVTLETFTAIIGVVLAGIALGTWIGGRMADTRPHPSSLLGPTLVIGGALAACAVPIVRVLGPPIGSAGIGGLVLLTALSMLPGTAVLSAVSPVVVKTVLSDLAETGATVGRISALGTAGAIFGTFASGFLLVAAFPTPEIIVGLAVMLVAAGIWLAFRFRPAGRSSAMLPAIAVAVVAGALTAFSNGPCDVETAYFCASDVPDPQGSGGSFLVLDTVTHAFIDPDDPTHLRFTSTRMFAAAIEAMTTGPVEAIHIGGGGFTMPSWLTATRPGSRNVVLELDATLVDYVFETWSPTPVDEILVGDARTSLGRAGGGFDVAIGDAFGGLAVPWHLTTVEFLGEISDALDTEGFYVMNIIDHGEFDFLRAKVATTSAVFPHTALVTLPERFEAGGNFMIVGSKVPIAAEGIAESAAALGLDVTVTTGDDLDSFVGDARVLTDDYAPVDQLLQPH